ncbi:hypothetical protein BV25DRAFT_1801482, partial [Artomyces pyxidatus]
SVVRRCDGLSGKGLGLDFIRMMSYIQLVMKCQTQLQANKKLSLTSLYDTLESDTAKKTSLRTFLDWHSRGSKYAAVASGGSVYALLLIAGLEMRVRLGEIEGKAPWILGTTLRDPPSADTVEGRLVRQQIVPIVARLRQELPLLMSAVFPVSLLAAQGLSNLVDCADLGDSDKLFSIIQFRDFALASRNSEVWASCYSDVGPGHPVETTDISNSFLHSGTSDRQGSLGPVTDNSTAVTPEELRASFSSAVKPVLESIDTRFKLTAEGNCQTRYPADKSANFAWTERERNRACKAVEVIDLPDLCRRLEMYYSFGIRSSPETYLSLPPQVIDDIEGRALRLNCSDGSLLALICTSMPEQLKKRLTDCLLASFGGRQSLVPTDSKSVGEGFNYEALYFTWYNRHCTQGDDAPEDISPMELYNSAASRTNHSQLTPYVSKEMRDEEDLFRTLQVVFADVFEWISTVVSTCLPDEYEILKMDADVLPGNNRSAVYPFVGFVVNLNVVTKAHRDDQDKLLCLVLTLGEFEGGSLVMVEPGLVLPLRSGDLVAFQSHRITHFNLHFRGLRASLVFHTDRAFDSWTRGDRRNGWSRNVALN